jgi:mRNA-degrading endonuclease YafQ of YafQ-DinJ toxin-antitoxin module
MPDYSLGKIYKIVDNTNQDVYIGSTCQPTLAQRLSQHKKDYKKYLEDKHGYTSSYKIFENGDYTIVLLESVNCESKDQLFQRERYYQDLIPNINKKKNARTDDEKQMVRIASDKRYYENNKEKRLETTKKWKEANDESIECDCGCVYKRYNQSIHLKSKKHKKYLNTE